MKKLIMAAVIVGVSVVQAASVNWKVATSKTMYEGNASTIYSGEAYFFTKVGTGSYTASTLLTALTTADIATLGGQMVTVGSDGLIAEQVFSTEASGTGSQSFIFAAQTDDQIFIWEGTKLNDQTESAALTGTSLSFNPKTASQSVVGAASAGFSDNGWYTVPEPTSGLLLLVGMCGLALRRRRA